MLPYPSGEPHIGHLKNYSLGDAIAHFHRRTGHRVLHPMGYDAFGLPAENHAINTGEHPRDSTRRLDRRVPQRVPAAGASRSTGRASWPRTSPSTTAGPSGSSWSFTSAASPTARRRRSSGARTTQTVLANEQVIDGRCERCGHVVEIRQLEQWFFRITDYADRLLDDLATIDWPEHVTAMQRNWIGRSAGAEVTFRSEEVGVDYPVFTTRPDTLFGATFFVMAPEHPDVGRLAAGTEYEQQVHDYVNRALTESVEVRGAADKPKTGVPLGRTVTNPVTDEQIPMFVADYVLMEYGTGAIMARPRPRPARLRLRGRVRVGDPPGGRAGRRRGPRGRGIRVAQRARAAGQLRAVQWDGRRRRAAGDHRLARPRRQGTRLGQLPAA